MRLLWRSRHNKGYRYRWKERFGYIDRSPTDSIWLHAVSVGETLAAIPLIKEIKQRYPKYNIIVTTTTPTGSALVLKHLKDSVMHTYLPYDLPSSINRFLRRSRARFCIILETELWPNMIRSCVAQRIPLMLANARLSERSMRRYRIIGRIMASMLRSLNMVAAQGILDGERMLKLGLDPTCLMIAGNIKFDIDIPKDAALRGKQTRSAWDTTDRPTLIAASTHETEEDILLEAFAIIRNDLPDSLLLIAPRHPDRFEKIKRLCIDKGYNIVQRSRQQKPTADTDIVLVDTIGDVRTLYSACDIAFVGGSLVPIGGHNLIEPAILGLPILTGPHLHNFTDTSRLLQDAGAAQVVTDAKSLARAVVALFAATDLREEIGKKAQQVIMANRGSLQKHIRWIEENFPVERRIMLHKKSPEKDKIPA